MARPPSFPKLPPTIEHDGRNWVELKQAARYIRRKAVLLEDEGRSGRFDLLELDGKLHMPLGIANRIRRETSSLRSIDRITKNERKPKKEGGVFSGGRYGPIAAHVDRDRQEVLQWSPHAKPKGGSDS